MANTSYKPVFSESGESGSSKIVFTTSTTKPSIGEEHTLYIFMDESQQYWWDPISNSYKPLGKSTVNEYKMGGDVSNFPYPGQEGVIYSDNTGKKYIWSSNSGTHWIRTNNMRHLTEEQIAELQDNIPFIRTECTADVLPIIYAKKNGKPTIVDYQIRKYATDEFGRLPSNDLNPNLQSFSSGFFGEPFYIIIPCYRETGNITPGRYNPVMVNSGTGTESYKAVSGTYIPIS